MKMWNTKSFFEISCLALDNVGLIRKGQIWACRPNMTPEVSGVMTIAEFHAVAVKTYIQNESIFDNL